MSPALAWANATEAPFGRVASAFLSPGTLTVGLVVSTTLITNEALVSLPARSSTVQTTSVCPTANMAPDPLAQSTGPAPEVASLAWVWNVTGAPADPVASAVIGTLGTDSVGGVLSRLISAEVAVV